MDKVQDFLITVSAAFAALCAWVVKKLWTRVDTLESRVDQLYRDHLKKSDLDKVIDIQHLILQNLLTKKETSNKDKS